MIILKSVSVGHLKTMKSVRFMILLVISFYSCSTNKESSLSNKPKCVLLDEPTGNLDDETSSSVQEMCLDINKAFNIGMFVATHDRGFASKMQYQYKIEHKSLMVIND